jgi:hypothetical protein
METIKNEGNSEKNLKTISSIITVIAIVIGVWYFYGGGVESGVASDEIKQYEISIKNNDHVNASVHAGVAAQAYLQAGDEANYKKWQKIADQEQDKITLE